MNHCILRTHVCVLVWCFQLTPSSHRAIVFQCLLRVYSFHRIQLFPLVFRQRLSNQVDGRKSIFFLVSCLWLALPMLQISSALEISSGGCNQECLFFSIFFEGFSSIAASIIAHFLSSTPCPFSNQSSSVDFFSGCSQGSA